MNRSKDKGTAWERLCADHLKGHGFPMADRMVQRGSRDRGDIGGVPVAIEAKHCSRMQLSLWAKEAEAEAVNAGTPGRWAIFSKRVGKGAASEGWAITSIGQYTELLRRAEGGS